MPIVPSRSRQIQELVAALAAASAAERESAEARLRLLGARAVLPLVAALRHTLDPDQQWPETHATEQSTEVKAEIYTDSNGRSVLAAPLILRVAAARLWHCRATASSCGASLAEHAEAPLAGAPAASVESMEQMRGKTA